MESRAPNIPLLPINLTHSKMKQSTTFAEGRALIWIPRSSTIEYFKPCPPSSFQPLTTNSVIVLSVIKSRSLHIGKRCCFRQPNDHVMILARPEILFKKTHAIKNSFPDHRATRQCHIAVEEQLLRITCLHMGVGRNWKQFFPPFIDRHSLSVHHP